MFVNITGVLIPAVSNFVLQSLYFFAKSIFSLLNSMECHYSDSFWHFGYENAKEIHVFVHGSVYKSSKGALRNTYGIWFGFADKRNEWGEIAGK